MRHKRYLRAESVLLERYAEWKRSLGSKHEKTQKVRLFLVELYRVADEPEKAEIFHLEYQTALAS